MANRYWVGGTGTWDVTSTANWSTTSGGSSGASVPTSTDDVFFDANSGGGTVDVQDFGSGLPSCAALDFTGFTGSFDSSSNALENYGDITLSSGGDFTLFVANIYASCTFTSNGKQIQDFYADGAVGGTGITVDLADDLNCSGVFFFTEGTFTTNNFNLTAFYFAWGALYSVNSTTINMGGSYFTINDNFAGTGWTILYNTSPSEVTVNAGTSTISFNNTIASSILLLEGTTPPSTSSSGKTYYNLEINGTAAVTIFGDNTFNTISNSTQPITINFAAGSTQTVTNFNVSGTAGNLVTLQSTTSGTQFTLSKASGTVSRDYLSIKDSNATGGATWNPGANSTNVSNNTGWTFPAPSAGTGNFLVFF